MGKNLSWRQTIKETDVANICELTKNTGVFSDEEVLVAAELVAEKLEKPECSYQFLFAETAEQVIAYTCFGVIPFTDQRFDLYWIAVSPAYQKQGLGGSILQRTEQVIREQQGGKIYIETSSREVYTPTRSFYLRHNYLQVAELKDYYRAGDNKIIYCKIM